MVDNILASSAAFIGLSIATFVATGIVAAGLFLEYERHELRVFDLRKTRPFHKDFPTVGQYRPAKKHIGSFLVVIGVALEALFGPLAFVSATIRESLNQARIAQLDREVSPRDLSAKQQADVANACASLSGRIVWLQVYAMDAEGLRLAVEIQSALEVAHVHVNSQPVIASSETLNPAAVIQGVQVRIPPDNRHIQETGLTIFEALKKKGNLAVSKMVGDKPGTGATIFVGVKPIPKPP